MGRSALRRRPAPGHHPVGLVKDRDAGRGAAAGAGGRRGIVGLDQFIGGQVGRLGDLRAGDLLHGFLEQQVAIPAVALELENLDEFLKRVQRAVQVQQGHAAALVERRNLGGRLHALGEDLLGVRGRCPW